jgi:hypothetical protein
MVDLAQFRLELERQLKIHSWKPSDAQIQVIASVIKQRSIVRELITADILGIVQTYADVDSFFIMDGIDHSDLTTLLLLATKTG